MDCLNIPLAHVHMLRSLAHELHLLDFWDSGIPESRKSGKSQHMVRKCFIPSTQGTFQGKHNLKIFLRWCRFVVVFKHYSKVYSR